MMTLTIKSEVLTARAKAPSTYTVISLNLLNIQRSRSNHLILVASWVHPSRGLKEHARYHKEGTGECYWGEGRLELACCQIPESRRKLVAGCQS